MPRLILNEDHIHSAIRDKVSHNRREIVEKVITATQKNQVVVVGMKNNPHCKRVRNDLDHQAVHYTYLEYGGYLTQWRRRNALKMWAGWPTFPMVFIDGVLIGGATDLQQLIQQGELHPLLSRNA